jgi:hypothetical protein
MAGPQAAGSIDGHHVKPRALLAALAHEHAEGTGTHGEATRPGVDLQGAITVTQGEAMAGHRTILVEQRLPASAAVAVLISRCEPLGTTRQHLDIVDARGGCPRQYAE